MKKNVSLLMLLMSFGLTLWGQTDYKIYLTHRLTFNAFPKDAPDAPQTTGLNKLPRGMEFSFGRRLAPYIRLNVPFAIGFAKASDDTTATGRTFLGGDCQLTFEYPKYRIVPYFSTGMSWHRRLNQSDIGLPFAAGINMRIDENAAINIQGLYRQSFKANNSSWHYGIGLVFQLGKIPFKKSPHTEGSPEMPRKILTETEELNIIGWWNNPSFALNLAAFPAQLNLPITDMDGDSVSDVLDDCPTVIGLVTNHGCPLKTNINLSALLDSCTIHFVFGKHQLNTEVFPYLDRLANIMQQDSSIRLKISGHTDNIGSNSINNTLSQKRASASYMYLISQGIEKTRFVVIGYGASIPKADNRSAQGRAINRRVTFELL